MARYPELVSAYFADSLKVRRHIPFYDVPTTAGRPIQQIASKPDVWEHVPPRRGRGKAGKFT